MSDQNLYETIEAYLNGDLSEGALSEFEARLQIDKGLADQVEIFRDIDSAVGDKPVLNFQKLVADEGKAFLKEEDQKNPNVKKINWRKYIIAAASMILLVAAIFIIKNQLNPLPSGQNLFAQHFESYDLNESLRGDINSPGFFDTGIEKYQAGDFEGAIKIFQEMHAKDQSNMILAFCLAQAYLNQKPTNFEASKSGFESIIQEGNSIYVSASKWYLALILLHQEEKTTAEKLLKELENDGGNWSIKAKELIDEIKE